MQLQKRIYKESELVDKICSKAQKRAYQEHRYFSSGKSRTMFLNELSKYCEFEYNRSAREYKIVDVFQYQKIPAILQRSIYQYLAPLIINELLFGDSDDEYRIVAVMTDFIKTIGIVNKNYYTAKYNQQAVVNNMDFSSDVLYDYFNKVDNCISEYMKRCIGYLVEIKCISFEKIYMLRTLPTQAEIVNGHIVVKVSDNRKATDDEIKLYLKLSDQAAQEVEIENEREKWYGLKKKKYNKVLNSLLREHNIVSFCRSIELRIIDIEKCKFVLKEYAKDKTIEQRKNEIGIMLKSIVDANAEKRVLKDLELKEDYLDQFKELSRITLLHDAENIMKMLPSVSDKRIQSKMQDKFNFTIEYAMSGGE